MARVTLGYQFTIQHSPGEQRGIETFSQTPDEEMWFWFSCWYQQVEVEHRFGHIKLGYKKSSRQALPWGAFSLWNKRAGKKLPIQSHFSQWKRWYAAWADTTKSCLKLTSDKCKKAVSLLSSVWWLPCFNVCPRKGQCMDSETSFNQRKNSF